MEVVSQVSVRLQKLAKARYWANIEMTQKCMLWCSRQVAWIDVSDALKIQICHGYAVLTCASCWEGSGRMLQGPVGVCFLHVMVLASNLLLLLL